MNKFNKYTTEHLQKMQQEISAIISERETNKIDEMLDNHPDELKEKETKEWRDWWIILDENPNEALFLFLDTYPDELKDRARELVRMMLDEYKDFKKALRTMDGVYQNPDEFIPRRPMHDKNKIDRRDTAWQKKWMESDDFKNNWRLVSKRTRTKAAVYKRIVADDSEAKRRHALLIAAYELRQAKKMNS